MARTPTGTLPKLRLHKKTKQAVVTLTNPRGGRRDYYLGKHGTEESQQKYQQLLARWIGGGRELPHVRVPVAGETPSTIRDLTERYLAWARTYYLRPDGTPSGETANLERACALLNEAVGKMHPQEFSPNRLREFRDALIEREHGVKLDTLGRRIEGTGYRFGRTYINDITRRVTGIFKWAESRELVPASTWHRLATVGSLRSGRSKARETPGLGPVAEAEVKATVEHLPRQVAALVWFCWHTGARMGEAVQLATRHVDMKGDVWLFRPPQHKNLHRGKDRVIPIGKEAQAVLRPFLQVVPDRRWFRPCDAVAESNVKRRPNLSGKRLATRLAKNQRRRVEKPRRVPSEAYTTNAVQVAIRRACQAIGIEPWTPHRLRHSALTRIREERGIEAAAAIGGHWTLNVTELYSTAAQQKLAVQVMRELG